MSSFFKFLDAYSLRARLFPAVLAVAPALAAVALLISWERIALSNSIATGALLVLLFAMADVARKQGLLTEPGIYNEMGGKPSVTMFRRADSTIDENAKEQYRQFFATKFKRPAPTASEEAANPAAGDSFYEQAGIWLRQNTRDAKKFPILWGELVSYGFRRNQLGLKWPSLALNLAVVLACAYVLWQREPLGMGDDVAIRIVGVLIVAAVHALYFLVVIDREGVKEAARRYGRELILSTQAFVTSSPRSGGRRAATTKKGARAVTT